MSLLPCVATRSNTKHVMQLYTVPKRWGITACPIEQ